MYRRVSEKIKYEQSERIEILSYKPEYKNHFRDLNYEWLNKFFTIENEDKVLLLNPEEEIIAKGGEIVFASYKGSIVGTAALLKYSESEYELAKMAVTEKVQGRQIGKKLAEQIIRLAKEKNAKTIFLETNVKLIAAMKLYKKLGFVLTENHNSKYARSTIKMELKLI